MKQSTWRLMKIVAIALGLSALACASAGNSVVDRALNRASNRVGDQVGDAVAAKVLAGWEPELVNAYTMAVFRMLFYHGGYYVASKPYTPGQFTRWQGENVQQGEWFERVLLDRRPDKSEWWRVETRATDDDGKQQRLVMEALLSPPTDGGTRKVRRMRVQFPGEAEPREVPVSEQSGSWVVSTDRSLTKESLQGMTVGKEKITTPAGTFETRHVQMKGYDNVSSISWYMTDKVPGGVVKSLNVITDEDKKQTTVWQMVLIEHGKGSTDSVLGIDFKEVEEPADDAESASL